MGQQLGYVNLTILNVTTPDVSKTFAVVLSLVDATSGRINSTLSTVSVILQSHGFINGKFDFLGPSVTVSVPTLSSFIMIPVTINRSVSFIGSVAVTYVVGTAVNTSLVPAIVNVDFYILDPHQTVNFADGTKAQTILVTLLSNSVPSLAKSFGLYLSNVLVNDVNTTSAAIGSNFEMDFVIAAHNNPGGVFSFGNSALNGSNNIYTSPNTAQVVNFQVVRSAGTIGNIVLTWNVASASVINLSPLSGSIIFTDGQTTGTLSITILPSAIPSLLAVYNVQLTSLSQTPDLCSINTSGSVAMLTVLLHNNPYGVFRLQDSSLSVHAPNTGVLTPYIFQVLYFLKMDLHVYVFGGLGGGVRGEGAA